MWLVGGIEKIIQYKNRWAILFIAVRKYMKKSVTPVRKVRQKVRFLAHSWKQGKTKCTDTEQSVSWPRFHQCTGKKLHLGETLCITDNSHKPEEKVMCPWIEKPVVSLSLSCMQVMVALSIIAPLNGSRKPRVMCPLQKE